jgi:hypothetical protein
MSREDIVQRIVNHLRLWKNANLNQEPYRSDSFKIFAAAFNEGMLTGKNNLNVDVLTKLILDADRNVVDVSSPYTNWTKFQVSWDEWTYAWCRAGHFMRSPP